VNVRKSLLGLPDMYQTHTEQLTIVVAVVVVFRASGVPGFKQAEQRERRGA
jgi:hypothetical protein